MKYKLGRRSFKSLIYIKLYLWGKSTSFFMTILAKQSHPRNNLISNALTDWPYETDLLLKLADPGLLLFIFVLFKHKFKRKNWRVRWMWTLNVGLEGDHADHLTTTTARKTDLCYCLINLPSSIIFQRFAGQIVNKRKWLRTSLRQTCGQSYKWFTLAIYDSRVVIWSIFKSGTTLEL